MVKSPAMHKIVTPVATDERAKLGLRAGDTVRVHQKIVEYKKGKGADKKEKITATARIQVFEGLVIAVKHGKQAGSTFTVRTTLSGIGVEKIFPLYSPAIDKIEIARRSKVRRAKLYFIREKASKEVRRQLRNMRTMNISTDDFKVIPEVAPEEGATEAEKNEEAVAA